MMVCILVLLLAVVLSLVSTVESFGGDLPVSKKRCGPKFGTKCQPTKCCSLWGFCGPPGTDHCKYAAPEQYQEDPAPYEPPGAALSAAPQTAAVSVTTQTATATGQAVDAAVAGLAAAGFAASPSSKVTWSKNAKKCWDVAGGPSAKGNGAKVRSWNCSGAANQNWTYNAASQMVKVDHSGKCLDLPEGQQADGSQLQQWDCDVNNPNQKWVPIGGGVMQKPNTNKCINMNGGKTKNGTPVQLWTCGVGNANQVWNLPNSWVPVTGATGVMDTLPSGSILNNDQMLTSKNGLLTLKMQSDGNLVLAQSGKTLWASNTAGVGVGPYILAMQIDGNLIVYDVNTINRWESKSNGSG